MLEEYLTRLENLITPNYYNKTNFKDKIKAEFEDPADVAEKKKKLLENTDLFNRIQTEEEKKLIDTYIEKMGAKDYNEENRKIPKENKLKIYEKILENENVEGAINTYSSIENKNIEGSVTGKSNKTYSLSPSRRQRLSENNPTEISMKEKIHLLNIKNMNYRYELETCKNKISELNKKVEEQQNEIVKLEKQKENNNKYLLKLENLLAQQNISDKLNLTISPSSGNRNSSKIISKNYLNNSHSKSENFIVDFNKTNNLVIEDKINNTVKNISDKIELKEFIANLISENQKLKSFQNQVFEISKNYDDINENIIEGIKQMQFSISDKDSDNKIDQNQIQNMSANFDKILENMEKTLEIKQSEYNFLLDSKDQEIKFLQEEILKMNETMEIVKRDRIRDQKVINDYESELNHLSSRVQEIGDKNNESSAKDVNVKLEKKVAPAKMTVQKIIKKFERTFDLQDKNNVKMLTNITKNIK